MNKRGLAALFEALSTPIGSHLDDETLAVMVDAEMAGEDIEALYGSQIGHIERCERCASAYSELMVLLQTAVEALGQEMAEPLPKADAPPLDISAIWRKALSFTAEQIGGHFRLRLLPDSGHYLRESPPIYGGDDEWPLPPLNLPTTRPLTLKAHFSRQTAESCGLTIKLQDLEGNPLANQSIQIQFDGQTKTAETAPDGAAAFNNIPIAALPRLTITIRPAPA
jgi:hypothetical protein